MEIINKMPQPAGLSYLTKPEPLPYILTPQDEENLLAAQIKKLVQEKAISLFQLGLSDEAVARKLTEIDFKATIDQKEFFQRENIFKTNDLWQKECAKRFSDEEKAQKQRLVATWTAEYLSKFIRYNANKVLIPEDKIFVADEYTLPLIKTICFFITRDPRFKTELGFSLNKGLLLRGISGLGKTFLLQMAANNLVNPVKIISMIEITDRLKETGHYAIKMEGAKIIDLDDVGTEETPVIHYGNRINFFKEFIEKADLTQSSFSNIIFSTNLSFQEIENKYGYRVRSRLRGRFNIINITGKDLRK